MKISFKEKDTHFVLNEGDTFGELGILLDLPRTATAQALGDVTVYKVMKTDFVEFLKHSPEVKAPLLALAESRIQELQLKNQGTNAPVDLAHVDFSAVTVSEKEVQEESKSAHKGGAHAALAIWLGIFIDGIPESMIIGLLAGSAEGMSLAFIAGVFLANMPEAMSSAVSMLKSGMSVKKIMLMWGSLCVLTGLGAYLGTLVFAGGNLEGDMFYFTLAIEGLAAGAMLTMIAETMLPEAFEQGGALSALQLSLVF